MNMIKRLIGKRGSEVVQNVLVLGAMGVIAILVMATLHGAFENAAVTASEAVTNRVGTVNTLAPFPLLPPQ